MSVFGYFLCLSKFYLIRITGFQEIVLDTVNKCMLLMLKVNPQVCYCILLLFMLLYRLCNIILRSNCYLYTFASTPPGITAIPTFRLEGQPKILDFSYFVLVW